QKVSGNLPSDFGFPIAVHPHEPETIYVVPIKSDSEHVPPDAKLRVYRSRTGGNEWEALTNGLPQEHCYVNVLRDAMDVDEMDPGGVYFGTTGGQVYGSSDGGDSWSAIVRDLPAVLSVAAQPLPGSALRCRSPYARSQGSTARWCSRCPTPRSGPFLMRSRRAIRPCAGRSVITAPRSAATSSASSPAARTSRSTRRTTRSRTRSSPGRNRSGSSGRWPAASCTAAGQSGLTLR